MKTSYKKELHHKITFFLSLNKRTHYLGAKILDFRFPYWQVVMFLLLDCHTFT